MAALRAAAALLQACRQMDFGEHAAHAAAAEALDDRDVGCGHLTDLSRARRWAASRLRQAVVDSAITFEPGGASSRRLPANACIWVLEISMISRPAARRRE